MRGITKRFRSRLSVAGPKAPSLLPTSKCRTVYRGMKPGPTVLFFLTICLLHFFFFLSRLLLPWRNGAQAASKGGASDRCLSIYAGVRPPRASRTPFPVVPLGLLPSTSSDRHLVPRCLDVPLQSASSPSSFLRLACCPRRAQIGHLAPR